MRQYMYSLQHSMYHRGKHVASDIYYSLESNFIALLGVSIWEDNIIYSFTFVFLVCIRSYPPPRPFFFSSLNSYYPPHDLILSSSILFTEPIMMCHLFGFPQLLTLECLLLGGGSSALLQWYLPY